jgi:lysophospholipase L1-like esterase
MTTVQRASAAGPFRRMVVIGDSIAYGMCAGQPENEWNQVLASLIREFQDEPLEVFNRGLPAEVISPGAPGYEESARPSLIERYHRHCVALQPDLVIIAEGLNDMRSGMAPQAYMADLTQIVTGIQRETGALVVLLGIYHQRFGCGANDPATVPTWTHWDPAIAQTYNLAIRLVAERTGSVFADATAAMGGADWTLNPDCCHPNDLGHVLVGNAIFQALAVHCPSLALKTDRVIREEHLWTANTGGADVDPEVESLWRAAAGRFDKAATHFSSGG